MRIDRIGQASEVFFADESRLEAKRCFRTFPTCPASVTIELNFISVQTRSSMAGKATGAHLMFDSHPQLVNCKILVIDDEQIIIDVITAHLNVAGFWNVVGISDSIDAVGRMKQENPDLILLDISMPDVSGNYLIQIARADPTLKDVPVIVVTAIDAQQTHDRALELGADKVLTKPLQPGTLVKHVERALSRKFAGNASSERQHKARGNSAGQNYSQLRDIGGRL